MKLIIDTKLKGMDGVSFIPNTTTSGFLTLKDVCIVTLCTPVQEDTEIIKHEKYDLYKKFKVAVKDVELTIEDLALVKKWVDKLQPQLIMGQCDELLEGKEENEIKKIKGK
jgi:hypothetical protein